MDILTVFFTLQIRWRRQCRVGGQEKRPAAILKTNPLATASKTLSSGLESCVCLCVIVDCLSIYSCLHSYITFSCITVIDIFLQTENCFWNTSLTYNGKCYRKQTWMVHFVIYFSAIVQLHVCNSLFIIIIWSMNGKGGLWQIEIRLVSMCVLFGLWG